MAHPDTQEAVDVPAVNSTVDPQAALANYFKQDEPDESPEDGEPEQEDFTDDDLADGEGVEGDDVDGDEEPEGVIDAPVSLTAEEKAEFASLPQEAQDYVSRLEQRRAKQVQEATTRASEAQRVAEAKAAQANAEAERVSADRFREFAQAFEPVAPDPSRYSDIQQYQRDLAIYNHTKAQHDQLVQQIGAIGVETPEQKAERIKARDEQLMTIPEVANPETRDQFISTAFEVAGELGYDTAELADTMDAGDLKALGAVAKWKADSAELAKIKARSKERRRDKKSGKFRSMKPGSAQPPRSGNEGFAKAQQRLRETGSDEAARAAFKEILS